MSGEGVQGPVFSHPFRWFPEFLELGKRRFQARGRLLGAALLVGLTTGLGGILFALACQLVLHFSLDYFAGYRPAAPAGEPSFAWLTETTQPFRPWMLIVLPALGGMVTGLMVFLLAPEAEGHGTDAAIAAYHHHQGQIRARVSFVKLVASAVTIGTGGSGGREGPIAQIGAGFGSQLGKWLRMTVAERRILLAAGIGAGVAAIFRAPLAGSLFAAEVLYWSPEFEPEVIIPAGLASVVSYCTFGVVFGWQPLFLTPQLSFSDPAQLIPYLLLAIAMAFLAMVYTRTFYGITAIFGRLPIPKYCKPVIGASLSGVTGVLLYYCFNGNQQVLSVLSFGYGILQEGMANELNLSPLILLAVAFGKILTTSLTIGSGGSGGVFGPSMVIGGCGGAAFGTLLHQVWPSLVPHPTSFMIVGMAGFFAAAAKTPFSTLIIVSEMTGDYRLLLPSLWVCTLAFLLSDEQSLYHSQVESRSNSPAHQGVFARQILARLTLVQFVVQVGDFPMLRWKDPLTKVTEGLVNGQHSAIPVVDDEQRLLGVVSFEEALIASNSPSAQQWLLAADLVRSKVTPLRLDESVERAFELFVENDLTSLPVVESNDGKKVVGLVRRSDLVRAYFRRVHA